METTLQRLLKDWDLWAETADQSNDGWPSDFPAWEELMQAAIAAMDKNDNDISSIEKCWLLSEEDERLSEYVKENPKQYLELLARLAHSEYPDVRWQVYDCLGEAGPPVSPMLEKGTVDSDAYARRRAVLALARISPQWVLAKLDEYCNDPDPYNKNVFSELKKKLLAKKPTDA
jgi:hypothetical protein